jgi:hypothetical protein
MKPIKTLLAFLLTLTLLSCGGGGGDNGGSSTQSALATAALQQLEDDLGTVSGIGTDQIESISTAASQQLASDGYSNSADVNNVLPSLMSGTMKGIGSLNLADENLINQLVEQSIATFMTLMGDNTPARTKQSRSKELSSSLKNLLEKLVETAVAGIEDLKLSEQAKETSLGTVIGAVVKNLKKAKIAASDLNTAIQSVSKSATKGLEKVTISQALKQGLRDKVGSSMDASIDELASSDPTFVTDKDSLKASASKGIQEGNSTLTVAKFDVGKYDDTIFGD